MLVLWISVVLLLFLGSSCEVCSQCNQETPSQSLSGSADTEEIPKLSPNQGAVLPSITDNNFHLQDHNAQPANNHDIPRGDLSHQNCLGDSEGGSVIDREEDSEEFCHDMKTDNIHLDNEVSDTLRDMNQRDTCHRQKSSIFGNSVDLRKSISSTEGASKPMAKHTVIFSSAADEVFLYQPISGGHEPLYQPVSEGHEPLSNSEKTFHIGNISPLHTDDSYEADKAHDLSIIEESPVRLLHSERDLERFLLEREVAIVFFYLDNGSEGLRRFLAEYHQSAEHLDHFHVFLAVADCQVFPTASIYCLPNKVNRFAYGFREQQEKIAFPLDTLFNNNAIVASALHLSLINAVPILQTAGERRDLEDRCKGRCDIIISFQRVLGTYEHRMFLEIAYAYQERYIFAITTYTAGTLGLDIGHTRAEDEHEQMLWAVHCADKTAQDECVVSHYRQKMVLPQLMNFINALHLPEWYEVTVWSDSEGVETPFSGSGLPWLLLVYDENSHQRVVNLAPHLGQLLHGTVATIALNLNVVSDAVLSKFGLDRQNMVPPALVFLQSGQEKASLLNDYDDPLEWVNEQVADMLQQQAILSVEEQDSLPVQALDELQQDDEVVMSMVREEMFNNIRPITTLQNYATALSVNPVTTVIFYLPWDPISNVLLQHVNEMGTKLKAYRSHAVLLRVNCFDRPNVCDAMEIVTYPVLRFHSRGGKRNATYTGTIQENFILREMLLFEHPSPVEVMEMTDVEALLALNPDFHPAASLFSAVALGIFSSAKESEAFMEAAGILGSTHLLGRHISRDAVAKICESCDGCIVMSKPGDAFQPTKVLQTHLHNPDAIVAFIRHSAFHILAQLDPERYSALSIADGSHSSRLLVILFVPFNASVPEFQFEEEINPVDSKALEELWMTFGRVAEELSEPGTIFSWLKCDDLMVRDMLALYKVSCGAPSLAALNPIEGAVYVYDHTNTSYAAIKQWLTSLREGQLNPFAELPHRDWEPRLQGFDYLKFMMEDQTRDSEDQLILEMEADLCLQNRGNSEEHQSDMA